MGPQPNKAALCHLVSCPTGTIQGCSLELASQGHSFQKKDSFFPPNRIGLSKGKFYLRQLPKGNQGSSFMSLRKKTNKKTHQRFALEELKEPSNLIRKAQHWNTARLLRLPHTQSLRGRDILGAHYVCGKSRKLQEGCCWKCGHKGPLGCAFATHRARLRIQLSVLTFI